MKLFEIAFPDLKNFIRVCSQQFLFRITQHLTCHGIDHYYFPVTDDEDEICLKSSVKSKLAKHVFTGCRNSSAREVILFFSFDLQNLRIMSKGYLKDRPFIRVAP